MRASPSNTPFTLFTPATPVRPAKHAGFTLIEMMIVVAIIAILAAIAVPSYTDYIRRGKISEVTALLTQGRVDMERFYQDNRTYVNAPCPGGSQYFNFACDRTLTTFLITGSGVGGSLTGFQYTINEANVRTSTIAAAQNWTDGNPHNCWTLRKGDVCPP